MPLSQKKIEYQQKLCKLINEYDAILMIGADNVGSKQMQSVRLSLRGRAIVLMGKNTTIRRVLADFLKANPGHPIENLLPYVRGNVGFVFTKPDLLAQVRKDVLAAKVPAPARVGSIAPIDVWVEPGMTGCDPGQTQWFQALNVPTKITRGQIEIVSRVHIISEEEKVSPSAASLCEKLHLMPFSYGLTVDTAYNAGEVFEARVLDLSEEDLLEKFSASIRAVAALCLELGFPTLASLPHSITNAFKALLSVALTTDYTFAAFEEFKAACAAGAAASAAPAAGAGAGAAAAEEDDDSSDGSAVGGAGDLFGGSDSDSDDSDSDSD